MLSPHQILCYFHVIFRDFLFHCQSFIDINIRKVSVLKADNSVLGNELTYFKEYCADLENEVNRKESMVNGLRLNLKSTTAERNEYCKKCNALSKELTEEKQKYNEFYETEYIARIEECNRLFGELMDIKSLSMFEFANKYCNDDELEEAGHAFARELLGGA